MKMYRSGEIVTLLFLATHSIYFKSIAASGKLLFREPLAYAEENVDSVGSGSSGSQRINLSIPGTKWCGPGNTASNYNDLGSQTEVDMCCRDHDHCDNIPAGETKYSLKNNDFFTVLHCDCDRKFSKCLHQINSNVSNRIGKMYFTLRNRCYQNDYPIVKCAEYETGVFVRRCVRYVLDESKPRRYQWFDLPIYYSNSKAETHDQFDDVYENDNIIY